MPSSLYSDDYVAFVDALVAVRRELGVTQDELAARLRKPQSFVSKSERRQRRIDVMEFVAIAEALGQDPGELLCRLRSAQTSDDGET